MPVPNPVPFRVGRRIDGHLQHLLPVLEEEKIDPPQAVFPPIHRIPEMKGCGVKGRHMVRNVRFQERIAVPFFAFPRVPGKAVLLPHEAGMGVQERVPAGRGRQEKHEEANQFAHDSKNLVPAKLKKAG